MPKRAFVSALVLAVTFVGTGLALAPAARASGPTSLGVSGWQVYSNTNLYVNPGASFHGDPREYAAAPAIPAQNSSGWVDCGPSAPLRSSPYAAPASLCPSASTIGMQVGSILSGCWNHLNFTSFQSLVSIPVGTSVSQFSVNMSGADDGARISLVNSLYPNGVTPANGYINQQTGQSTGNLASYVVAGEVNRVVITQVDDCAVGNNLNSAQIFLNGTVIPPAPADSTPPTDSPVVTPVANANGWNNSDVAVNWNWTDAGSGIDPNSCTQSSTSTGEGAITLISTCQDLAGNKASDSVKVNVDKTLPTDSPVVTPVANANGWNNSDVAVNWNWTDAGSGIDPNNCTQSSTSSGEGTLTLTSTCQDLAGNGASASYSIKVDTTSPVAAPTQAPVANANGWNNSDVTVNWNWTDAGSGIDLNNCTQSSTSTGEGTLTLTSNCQDLAGNVASASYSIKVDTTSPVAAPTQAPAANANGWNNSDVTVNWNWTDAGSGIDLNNCTQSSTSTGEGALTLTSNCQDLAGNGASASYSIKVDKTSPVVTYSGNAGTYKVDQTVSISCSASDALSGIASQTCTNVSGPAWSFGLGTYSVSATATDNASNTGSNSASFKVTVDEASLCAFVHAFSTNSGIANSLCVKLDAASAAAVRGQSKTELNNLRAFVDEVAAQSGKAFTASQATLLTAFAKTLYYVIN